MMRSGQEQLMEVLEYVNDSYRGGKHVRTVTVEYNFNVLSQHWRVIARNLPEGAAEEMRLEFKGFARVIPMGEEVMVTPC